MARFTLLVFGGGHGLAATTGCSKIDASTLAFPITVAGRFQAGGATDFARPVGGRRGGGLLVAGLRSRGRGRRSGGVVSDHDAWCSIEWDAPGGAALLSFHDRLISSSEGHSEPPVKLISWPTRCARCGPAPDSQGLTTARRGMSMQALRRAPAGRVHLRTSHQDALGKHRHAGYRRR